MLIDQKTYREYYPTGELMWECTRATISPLFADAYHKTCRIHPDGHHWIYIGNVTKWNKNGDIIWQLEYEKNGFVVGCTQKPEKNNQNLGLH